MALSKEDIIIGNHRSHGYLIAKGTDIGLLMSQVFKGDGASMHVSDPSVGAICSTAIVGSGLPLACGVAFATKLKKENRVTCVFFGDGAVNEGAFYESINLASLWQLPVLFILENNGVAVTTQLDTVSNDSFLSNRVKPFGINRQIVNGQDVTQIFNMTTLMTGFMRNKSQPVLIEASTFRFHEHQEGKAYEAMKLTNYRDSKEVDYWIENKDPIKLYSEELIKNGFSRDKIRDIYSEESDLIDDAVEFALKT
jgi:acetoin:2,6-dichlorophenolindophenol oxidoreductase subunit alpha